MWYEPHKYSNRLNHTAHTLITSVCLHRSIITVTLTNLLLDAPCRWSDNQSWPETRAHTQSSEHYSCWLFIANRAQYEEYDGSSV